MSLHNYLVKSNVPYQEIWSDFDLEQVQQLYNQLKDLGYRKYHAFVVEHQKDILKYISLSHSQRQQKKWVNHSDNLLIRLASLQISAATVQLLDDIQQIELIVDGGSYRQFHSAVADGVLSLTLAMPLSDFPFEDFENPFLS